MIWIATGSFVAGALLWAIWRGRQPEMKGITLGLRSAAVLPGLFGAPVAVLSPTGGLIAAAAADLSGRS